MAKRVKSKRAIQEKGMAIVDIPIDNRLIRESPRTLRALNTLAALMGYLVTRAGYVIQAHTLVERHGSSETMWPDGISLIFEPDNASEQSSTRELGNAKGKFECPKGMTPSFEIRRAGERYDWMARMPAPPTELRANMSALDGALIPPVEDFHGWQIKIGKAQRFFPLGGAINEYRMFDIKSPQHGYVIGNCQWYPESLAMDWRWPSSSRPEAYMGYKAQGTRVCPR
jgi:hypothetical protein